MGNKSSKRSAKESLGSEKFVNPRNVKYESNYTNNKFLLRNS